MLLSKKKGWIKDMGIELKLCSKCGGKGRLYDFDHNYNPKNKSIKFLNKGNGLSTAAECLKCGRYTEHFWVPIDAINSWNKGEMYSGREWEDKRAREYNGKVCSDEEIRNYIFQTKLDSYGVEIYFTNGCSERVFIDKYDSEYIIVGMGIVEKKLEKVVIDILEYIKKRNIKVKEIEYIKD